MLGTNQLSARTTDKISLDKELVVCKSTGRAANTPQNAQWDLLTESGRGGGHRGCTKLTYVEKMGEEWGWWQRVVF